MIYQYSESLIENGFSVTIVNNVFQKSNEKWLVEQLRKVHSVFRHITSHILHPAGCRSWFPLSNEIAVKSAWSFDRKRMPTADIYIATDATTAHYLLDYPVKDSHKLYFIQGYENWRMTDKQLRSTYHFPFTKIVISNWLKRIMDEEGVDSILAPIGFNDSEFYLSSPIEGRNKYMVSMLFHQAELKNSKLGFSALEIVKKRYPELKVNIFGVFPEPKDLPDWYTYYQSPSQEIHNKLNNESAIYIGTSSLEGWGLTIGEAMMCGEAVVCTDIDGYKELAEDQVNSLISPVDDAESMAANICRLIEDDALRIRLAEAGLKYIKNFSLQESQKRFVDIIKSIV